MKSKQEPITTANTGVSSQGLLGVFPFRHFFDFTLALSENFFNFLLSTTSFIHLLDRQADWSRRRLSTPDYYQQADLNIILSLNNLQVTKAHLNKYSLNKASLRQLNTHVNAGNIFGLFNLLSKLSIVLRCRLQLSASNRNHPTSEPKWRLKLNPSRSSNAPSKVAPLPLTN